MLRSGARVPVFVHVGFCLLSHLIWEQILSNLQILSVINSTHSLFHRLRFLVPLTFTWLK